MQPQMMISTNMSYVFPLLLVIVMLALHRNEAQSHVNPGLQSCVTQLGIDYINGELMDMICATLQEVKVPDLSGSVTIFIGHIKYGITNVQITEFTKPSSSILLAPDLITWTLSHGSITAEGNWTYKYKKWFIEFADMGRFTGLVSDASIALSLSLGNDSTGHPTISSAGCNCTISSISLELSGGSSWFYNMLTGYAEKPIRSQLQKKLCDATTEVINRNANDLLKSFPLQQIINTNWLLDYRLLSAPSIHIGYLYTRHKGTFYYKNNLIEPPIRAEPLPTKTRSDKMMTIWMSEYVLNTVGYAIFMRNLLKHNFTKKDLPHNTRSYFSTACSEEEKCLGNMSPEISNNYPNSFLEVEMDVIKAPTINISTSQIQVTLSAVVTCRVRLSDISDIEILKVSVVMNALIAVTVNANILKFRITHLMPSVEVISSSVGQLSREDLLSAFNYLSNLVFLPFLNNRLGLGIPIPVPDKIKFINLEMEMLDHCLHITADIKRA